MEKGGRMSPINKLLEIYSSEERDKAPLMYRALRGMGFIDTDDNQITITTTIGRYLNPSMLENYDNDAHKLMRGLLTVLYYQIKATHKVNNIWRVM
jgi:hypothetical protein